jgi:hypothetical protein
VRVTVLTILGGKESLNDEDPYIRATMAWISATKTLSLGDGSLASQMAMHAAALCPDIQDDMQRVSTCAGVTDVLVKTGDLEAAAITARVVHNSAMQIENEFNRGLALSSAVASLALAGEISSALGAMKQAPDQYFLANLIQVISNQAINGDVLGAMKTAEMARDLEEREEALATVGLVIARKGKVDEAYKMAKEIRDGSKRARIFAAVARNQAQINQIDLAFQTAFGIEGDDYWRALALAWVVLEGY